MSLSLSEYPKYENTDALLVHSLPADWNAVCLKHLAEINMGQSPSSDDYNHDGEGFPFLQGNAEFGQKHPVAKQHCNTARKIADSGSYLFSVRAPVGAINVADQQYGIGRGLCAISPNERVRHGFLGWALVESRSYLDAISTGSTFEAVSAEQVGNTKFPLPTADEQKQIASFLDYETSKIDALIEKQQQLIALLGEKRQAVISHAVTKGLNPDAPMRDSGVEWLGEVPSHWEVSRIKHLCYVNDGNHGEEYPKADDYADEDDGVPFIRGGNMENFQITNEGMLYITKRKNASMRKGRLQAGDVLFMNRGDIGKLALISDDHVGSNLNSQIAYLRCERDDISNRFLLYFLASDLLRSHVASLKMGSVLTQFPIADIVAIPVPLPDSHEQLQIVAHIERHLEKLDELVAKAATSLELLQERRTALISAAVTGKIDVRGWKRPSAAPKKETEMELA